MLINYVRDMGLDVKIRASIGTLAKLGIVSLKLLAEPTTAYFLQYSPYGCLAHCMFCTQSMHSRSSKELLSRVLWPLIDLDTVLRQWYVVKPNFKRICIQSVIKLGFIDELIAMTKIFSERTDIPISISITPIPLRYIRIFKNLGVDCIGIGLDASSPQIFMKIQKPYSWITYIEFIMKSIEIFGKYSVYVHLIAGLGEDIKEFIDTMLFLHRIGARIALFNYTYVKGTKRFPGIDIAIYRALQIVRQLIEMDFNPYDYIELKHGKIKFRKVPPIDIDKALLTSGCPYCNRPFYNESPYGPIYNFPSIDLLRKFEDRIKKELRSIGLSF